MTWESRMTWGGLAPDRQMLLLIIVLVVVTLLVLSWGSGLLLKFLRLRRGGGRVRRDDGVFPPWLS